MNSWSVSQTVDGDHWWDHEPIFGEFQKCLKQTKNSFTSCRRKSLTGMLTCGARSSSCPQMSQVPIFSSMWHVRDHRFHPLAGLESSSGTSRPPVQPSGYAGRTGKVLGKISRDSNSGKSLQTQVICKVPRSLGDRGP